jgi:dipeptidyl aminopeptidase/acylaminoacyl peptidase
VKNMRLILLVLTAFSLLTACDLLIGKTPAQQPAVQPVLTITLPTATRPPIAPSPTASPIPPSPTSTATLTPTVKSAAVRPSPSRTLPPSVVTRKILYSQCDAQCAQPVDAHLWIVNVDGSSAIKIVDYGYSASFAPDGTRLAFEHTQGGIYVANSDGSNQVKIVPDGSVGEPDWSHNGQQIAFVNRTRSPNSTSPEPGAPPPPPPPFCPPGKVCREPFHSISLSLDPGSAGTLPARADLAFQLGTVFIEVVAPDGTGRRTVTPGNHPTWSADDAQIAYDTCVGGTCGIFKINQGGGTPVQVTDDVGSIPHWSRDGKKILYGADVDGVRQLFVVNPDGTGKKQLTSGKDFHVDGVWSMDNSTILYRSTAGGSWGLWAMKADGSSPHMVLGSISPVKWGDEKLSVSK